MAHNHEVARSKRVSGIILFVSFIVLPHNPPAYSWGDQKFTVNALATLNQCNYITTNTLTLHRGGAEGARGAHNSEVIGSNPISGIV